MCTAVLHHALHTAHSAAQRGTAVQAAPTWPPIPRRCQKLCACRLGCRAGRCRSRQQVSTSQHESARVSRHQRPGPRVLQVHEYMPWPAGAHLSSHLAPQELAIFVQVVPARLRRSPCTSRRCMSGCTRALCRELTAGGALVPSSQVGRRAGRRGALYGPLLRAGRPPARWQRHVPCLHNTHIATTGLPTSRQGQPSQHPPPVATCAGQWMRCRRCPPHRSGRDGCNRPLQGGDMRAGKHEGHRRAEVGMSPGRRAWGCMECGCCDPVPRLLPASQAPGSRAVCWHACCWPTDAGSVQPADRTTAISQHQAGSTHLRDGRCRCPQ